MNAPWDRMLAAAEAEVAAVLAALPPDVRRRAEAVPIVFERRPDRALVAAGFEPDTLGLFEGASALEEPEAGPWPARIRLFLDCIWEEAEGRERRFRRELRTTLLHEIGHALGWEEADLEARGLE